MAMKDYQMRATKKYKEAHYEFVNLRLLIGERDVLKHKAEAEGVSLNQYIRKKLDLD